MFERESPKKWGAQIGGDGEGGPSYIFNRLSQDTILISDSAHVIFASFGALIMLVFATVSS